MAEAQRRISEVIDVIRVAPPTIESWILKDDHEQVQAWLASYPPKKDAQREEVEAGFCEFLDVDYDLLFQDIGFESMSHALSKATSATVFRCIAKHQLSRLTDRQIATLCYKLLTTPREKLDDPTNIFIWDLNFNPDRCSTCMNHSPIVVTTSVLWMHRGGDIPYASEARDWQSRLLVPPEIFEAQGWCLEELGICVTPWIASRGARPSDGLHYTFREMVAFAGDAFNGCAFNTAMALAFLVWDPSEPIQPSELNKG